MANKPKTKTERQAETARRLAATMHEVPLQPMSGDQKVVSSPATAPVEQASGDQNDVKAKRKRKLSAGYLRYVDTELPAADKVIRIQKDYAERNPKRSKGTTGAKERFALYRNGMTVEQYIKASTDAGNPKALAQNDVRWDIAHDFIVCE